MRVYRVYTITTHLITIPIKAQKQLNLGPDSQTVYPFSNNKHLCLVFTLESIKKVDHWHLRLSLIRLRKSKTAMLGGDMIRATHVVTYINRHSYDVVQRQTMSGGYYQLW